MRETEKKVKKILSFLYGEEQARDIYPRLMSLVDSAREQIDISPRSERFSSEDSVLITYADMVTQPGEKPLETLSGFLRDHIAGTVNTVHLLPFFPYSSDDGFSVIDYSRVDPGIGSWEHVQEFRSDFHLMFDAVINHISAESEWFNAYLQGDPAFEDSFIEITPDMDLEAVFRPRALPIFREIETSKGLRHVWTTFSPDQIDLNYRSPQVLLSVVEILLDYVWHGAEMIRLDAVAYLWKEPGTSCIHLPQTHAVIKLLRLILDLAAPGVLIITETNVPHRENISYFGSGDEAHMVYNFSLPPLVLHTFATGRVDILSDWARSLKTPVQNVSFFNFLASHDGIGLTPAAGILSSAQIQNLMDRTLQLGGHISEKSNPDGTRTAYEMNINYLDALQDPDNLHDTDDLVVHRFLASQAIMLAMKGVPGIYFHSLFGSRNWQEGVRQSGRLRTINRQKLLRDQLERELGDPVSIRSRVFRIYQNLLQARRSHMAFHPLGNQTLLQLDSAVFALLRSDPDTDSRVLCLQNVSSEPRDVEVPLTILALKGTIEVDDILGKHRGLPVDHSIQVRLEPYQTVWLALRERSL